MKDIYELLNYAEVDLKEYDETELNDIDKKKFKNKLHSHIKSKRYNLGKMTKFAAVFLAILILAGVVTYKTNPTFAKEMPILGTIIKNVEDYNNHEFDKYTSVINKTLEKNGFKVTLNEIAIDHNKLIIAATFKSTEKLPENSPPATMNPTVFINGKQINVGGGGNKKFIDNYTYVTVDELDVSSIKIPDNINMKIIYKDFEIYQKGQKDFKTINGPWEFQFNVSKKEIENKTNTIKINKNIKFKDIDMDIKDINITPLSTQISFDFKCDTPLDSMADPLYFIITDNKGNYLSMQGGSFAPNKDIVNYADKESPSFITFSAVPKGTDKLYITPYHRSFNKDDRPEETEPIKFNNNLPIVLKQNNESRLIVTNIERKNGKIYVKYKAEGICIGIPENRLYLYDSNKKQLDTEDVGNVENGTNNKDTILMTFKDRTDGDIYVGTDDMSDIIVLKNKEFTVDLKK